MRRIRLLTALLGAALACLALGPGPALAAFGVEKFEVTFNDENGLAVSEAGAHPFAFTTALEFNTVDDPEHGIVPDGAAKSLRIEAPPGLVANPEATPRCPSADFIDVDEGTKLPHCPDSSAVGTVTVELENPGKFSSFPVYNLEPPPGVVAKIGFIAVEVPVAVNLGLKTSPPYNGLASLTNIAQPLAVYGASTTLWGNPADPAHDPFRGSCVSATAETTTPIVISKGKCKAGGSPRPFITLPRSCTGPLLTLFEIESWQNPGTFLKGGDESPAMGECSKLGLRAEISAQPTSRAAESGSGFDFDLDVTDEGINSPTGSGQSDIKKAVVTLPQGVTINPSQAEGLAACSPADYARETLASAPGEGCPQAAKVGTMQAQSPLLEHETLEGSVFVAQPDDPATTLPGAENPFDTLIGLYLVIRDPELGVFVKLAGKAELDPQSGQITTTFEDLPQLPVSHFHFHFFEGARSPLVTPPTCGNYTTVAELTPWAGGPVVQSTSTFQIGSGINGGPCPSGPKPFHPALSAGSLNNDAGAYSTFFTRLTRKDGEQELTRFDATLPPGVVAKIAGVGKCPDAAVAAAKAKSGREELAAPSCPAASQIATTLAGGGVGNALTYVPGKVYLGGPFAGNPLSLIAITPAVAGPFDAGTVALRFGLTIDPNTYRAKVDSAHSDPIPRILKGIPLRARDIRVFVDRPNFTLNPTSCDPFATLALVSGAEGAQATPSDRYQAAGCSRLPFKPKLALKLTGGTKRGDHPAFKATLTPRAGDANIGRSVVTLPPSQFIDNAHIQNPCTRVQFNADNCPRGSILGTATAHSPLLDEPLKGPVYFRSNGGERLLPDVVVDLHGLFHITLVGFVDSKNARIRTTFASVPDAPASRFVLSFKGGKKGLLVNNRNLCAHKLRAGVDFSGQNGKPRKFNPVVKTSCKGKAAKRAKRR